MKELDDFVEKNVQFKEMYSKMMRASEEAIRILIEAQRECEEMYLNATEPMLEKIANAYSSIFSDDEGNDKSGESPR